MKKVYFNYNRGVVNPECSRRGFTIIELLIVIFIFSTVMIMASSSFATSYISGRTHSSSSMEANRSLTTVLDVIGQKMANASGDAHFLSSHFYGFYVINGPDRLITVLSNGDCAYFVLDQGKIKMMQKACATTSDADLSIYSTWETISSPDINIDTFDLTNRYQCPSAQPTICAAPPYLTVKISGTDTKTKGKAALETTYSIPAYTYNKW